MTCPLFDVQMGGVAVGASGVSVGTGVRVNSGVGVGSGVSVGGGDTTITCGVGATGANGSQAIRPKSNTQITSGMWVRFRIGVYYSQICVLGYVVAVRNSLEMPCGASPGP